MLVYGTRNNSSRLSISQVEQTVDRPTSGASIFSHNDVILCFNLKS